MSETDVRRRKAFINLTWGIFFIAACLAFLYRTIELPSDSRRVVGMICFPVSGILAAYRIRLFLQNYR